MALKTNFKDALPNGVLKYRMVQNEDGTVSFIDVTEYAQTGDRFGAKEVNEIARVINGIPESICDVYNSEKTYKKGDHCIYDSVLYECNTEITIAEEWTAEHWTSIKIIDVLDKQNDNISALQTLMQSFEQAKSKIISSALGKVLGMISTTPLADVADKIMAVVNRGALNWSASNATHAVQPGYYTGGTLDSRPAYNNGYNTGYNAGVAAKTTAYKTGTWTTTRAGRIELGFQPNVFFCKSTDDSVANPMGVYCEIGGITMNRMEGASNTHLIDIFVPYATGMSLADKSLSYADKKTIKYFAAKVV